MIINTSNLLPVKAKTALPDLRLFDLTEIPPLTTPNGCQNHPSTQQGWTGLLNVVLNFHYSATSYTLGIGLSRPRFRVPLRTMHREMGKGISKGNYSDTDLSDNVHFSKDDYIVPQSAEAPTLIFYLVGWPNMLRSSQGITTPLKKLLRATIYDSDSFDCCLTSRRICSSAVIPASAKQCLGDKLGKLMTLERDAR